ncbi:MAG TPA: hypothetical protein VF815_03120 [Myxococcaceae bacterium]
MTALSSVSSTSTPSVRPGLQGPSLPAASSFQARLGQAGGGTAPVPREALPTGGDILQQTFQDMRQMLRLQYELTQGTTSLISNVLKTRHDTAKNSIQNIR